MDLFGDALSAANEGWDFAGSMDWTMGGGEWMDWGDGVLDFSTEEWGIDIAEGMDSDIFDFGDDPYLGYDPELFTDVGPGSAAEMGFDPMTDFAEGGFMDALSHLSGEALSVGKSVAGQLGKNLVSSGEKSVAGAAKDVATKAVTKAGTDLAKRAISQATSPGGKQTGAGTQKPSTGLGGLGESFKLPLSTKLGGYQAAAPTAKFPPKPGQASRAGVEAAKIQGRGQLDQTRRWLQQVAMSDTYSTSYTPSLSKRYSLGAT